MKTLHTETRKINLIQEVLNLDDDTILGQIEELLKVTKQSKKKRTLRDLAGSLTKEEAAEWDAIIKETEMIHEDDWK